jgi:serine/threonine protein kinase
MSVELAEDDDRAKPHLIGQVLANRYQIECELGEGAMGTVFKAKHVKVGRPFAVKVLHKKLIEDRKVLQRFEREAELAGRLRHPNVVGVVDVGETADGFRYMVMDFAEGNDLATMLNEAPMPAERIINLTRQMLEGLYHAHEQGLIHRDFKPENVIIERDDHGKEVPRIVDFGIAILREGGESSSSTGRLTTNGLVLGTPHYMAPEQAVADPIDHRIDLFALGIVIYEMLSGKLPFDGTGAEVARANLLLDPPVISQRVPFLEVDPLLEAFARRMMAKKREMRPATAKAARELLDLITSDPASAAAALGVPHVIAAASRQPAVTQPTTPVQPAREDMLDAAIVSASSAFEAPAYPTPSPLDDRRRAEQSIRTDAATPLAYGDTDDVPEPKRRGLLIGAALGAVAVIAIVIFAVSRGGSDETKPTEPTKVVMQADPPKVIAEVPKDPPKVDPALVDPPVVDPPIDAKPEIKKPEIKKPEIKKPEIKKPETPVKAPEVPTTAPAITMDAKTLYKLYVEVGNELATAAKTNPPGIGPLADDYRRIQIQEAMSTEPNRVKYGSALVSIRKKLGGLASNKP